MNLLSIKLIVARMLRRIGIVASSFGSSPQGRIKRLLKTYDINTVLDVGANEGQFARMLRREAGFKGAIVSFEPMSKAFSLLERSARGDNNWKLFRCALGDSDQVMEINVAQNSCSSSLLPAQATLHHVAPETTYVDKELVTVRALDNLCQELHLPQSGVYLKIDAQGFESKVLEGAKRALESIDTVQLEMPLTPMYEGAVPFDELIMFMKSKGYRLVHLVPGFYNRESGELIECDGIFHRKRGS